MKTSSYGINLIKQFEGCRLEAYDDAQPNVKLSATTPIKGTLTIGYGHTGKVNNKPIKWNTKITLKTAETLLKKDLVKYERLVKFYPQYEWTQNEFDALVSFCYNIGSINQLTDDGLRSKNVIANKMLLYHNFKGKDSGGLIKRREKEQQLFLTK
jgi:GH24 family phage-related lysozyme (muramidase)